MSDSESISSGSNKTDANSENDTLNGFEKKLGKRLAYLLRYGAEKEGLKVTDEGYVELLELLRVPLLRHNKATEILKEVDTVTSSGHRRFEKIHKNGSVYIRAVYGRRMERNPHHEGTKVPRLMECCLVQICDNITDYDLQDFPDEYLVLAIMHKLKRHNRLTNKAFFTLLGPNIEKLDLGGVMITSGTIKLVGERCPHLKELNLRETSYLLNDHIMENFLKKVPKLESLNLSGCVHQTDRTIHAIIKHLPEINQLNLCHIPNLSQEAILKLLTTCAHIKHLDIYDNRNITSEGREVLAEFCRQKQVSVILQGLDIEMDGTKNQSLSLKLASVGKYW